MLIRRRGLSRVQIAIALILGSIGGVYVWKPVFDKFLHEEHQKKVTTENKDSSFDQEGDKAK